MSPYIIQLKIEMSEYQCGYWYRSFGQMSSSIIANASLYNLTENRNIFRKKNYFSKIEYWRH